jgi:hypothetical protein
LVIILANRSPGSPPASPAITTGADFNPCDPIYEGYTFVTTLQSNAHVRLRGMELAYHQSLSFLPGRFQGSRRPRQLLPQLRPGDRRQRGAAPRRSVQLRYYESPLAVEATPTGWRVHRMGKGTSRAE